MDNGMLDTDANGLLERSSTMAVRGSSAIRTILRSWILPLNMAEQLLLRK